MHIGFNETLTKKDVGAWAFAYFRIGKIGKCEIWPSQATSLQVLELTCKVLFRISLACFLPHPLLGWTLAGYVVQVTLTMQLRHHHMSNKTAAFHQCRPVPYRSRANHLRRHRQYYWRPKNSFRTGLQRHVRIVSSFHAALVTA